MTSKHVEHTPDPTGCDYGFVSYTDAWSHQRAELVLLEDHLHLLLLVPGKHSPPQLWDEVQTLGRLVLKAMYNLAQPRKSKLISLSSPLPIASLLLPPLPPGRLLPCPVHPYPPPARWKSGSHPRTGEWNAFYGAYGTSQAPCAGTVLQDSELQTDRYTLCDTT